MTSEKYQLNIELQRNVHRQRRVQPHGRSQWDVFVVAIYYSVTSRVRYRPGL